MKVGCVTAMAEMRLAKRLRMAHPVGRPTGGRLPSTPGQRAPAFAASPVGKSDRDSEDVDWRYVTTPDGEKKLFDRLELMRNQLATIEDLLRQWGGQLTTPPGAQIPDINDRSEQAPFPEPPRTRWNEEQRCQES